MKSILIGLLFLTSIAWSQSSTGADSVYCLPLAKARLLVADAFRLRYMDNLNNNLSQRIELLDSEIASVHDSYTNLLKLSEQKFETQKEITTDFVRLADSWRDESDYYQRRYRKQRKQKGLLTAGMVGLIGLIIMK